MAKEIVYGDNFQVHDPEGNVIDFMGPAIKVTWGAPAEFVSVATLDIDSEHLVDTPQAGFYVDLDRDGINCLIRALRKARQDTYGADE